MTSLRVSKLGRLVFSILMLTLVMMTVMPSLALARVEFVNGSGSVEGDPGDGDEYSGGGGSSYDDGLDRVSTGTPDSYLNEFHGYLVKPVTLFGLTKKVIFIPSTWNGYLQFFIVENPNDTDLVGGLK